MKKSTSFLAFFSALIASAFTGITCGLILFFHPDISQGLLLLITLMVFFASSIFCIHYAMDIYLSARVKQIYKTIFKAKKEDIDSLIKQKGVDKLGDLNKDVQDRLEKSREEVKHLKKLEQYRRDFIGNVSHELKTPIFNIQGYVLTLLDGGLEDPNINRKYLLRTEKSIDRLINIVNDLETINKVESDIIQLKQTRFDIVVLIKEVFEIIEAKAKKQGISLTLKHPANKPMFVHADMEKIRQVLTNLLVNSINYGKENGKTCISFFDVDDSVLIEVTDNGIGIKDEDLPRVFERFYRTDISRSISVSGTGLGLAIVKHLLDAHNQTINVRSEFGQGSTFSFMLPKGK